MPQFYAVKSPGGLLWSRQIDRDEVMAWFLEQRIERDWFICPQGESKLAVTVGEFIDEPGVLQLKLREKKARAMRRRFLTKTLAKPTLHSWGRTLLWSGGVGIGFGCPSVCAIGLVLDQREVVTPILMTATLSISFIAVAVGAAFYVAANVIHHMHVNSVMRAEDAADSTDATIR